MNKLLLLILLAFKLGIALADTSNPFLRITYPTNRMVFQRGTNDRANIHFAAQYQKPFTISSAQYRFQPLGLLAGDNLGTPPAWINIGFNNIAGTFKSLIGTENLLKGWYKLEIRILNQNGVQTDLSSIKVGVGDVFLIAGQSDSQGYNGTDDPNVIPFYAGGLTDSQIPDAINICNLIVTNEDFNFVPTKKRPIKRVQFKTSHPLKLPKFYLAKYVYKFVKTNKWIFYLKLIAIII